MIGWEIQGRGSGLLLKEMLKVAPSDNVLTGDCLG